MGKILVKKFLTYLYGSGIGLFIGLFITMFSTRFLSPEDFGKASMFTLAVNVLMIFIIFGTDQAFVRFFYEEAIELRGKLLLNSMKLPLILLTIILLLLFLFKDKLMLFLFDSDSNEIFIVLVTSLIFQVIYRFSILIIRMQQKGHMYSFMQVLYKISNLVFLIILFYMIGPKYEILIYSIGISLLLVTIISIWSERYFWKSTVVKNGVSKHSQREIFKYSYPLVFTLLITWLFQAIDKIAIRHWSDFRELGLYSAAFQIAGLLSVVQGAFSTFWAPVCYEQFEKNPNDSILFSVTSRVVSVVMFTIAILIILFKDIIVLLLGVEFKEASLIIPFLIFIPMMNTISETTVIGINFYKKTNWHIVISLTVCFTNIVGNIILVPHFGASGAAISTAGSYVLFFIMRTHISLKYYHVNYALKKIYFCIICIAGYAMQNILIGNVILNCAIGVLLLFMIAVLYRKDFRKTLHIYFLNDRV